MALSEKTAITLAALALALGVFARLFGFAVLPESAYADSLFHLRIISEALKTGIIQTPDMLTTPLYHYLNFAFYSITRLPVQMPFIRIIPFFVMLAQIILSFLIISRLFKSRAAILGGTAFVAVFPWLVRYSPVNYIDSFASVMLLLFYFLLLRSLEKPSKTSLAFLCLSIPLVVLSKITVAILLPILLVSCWVLLSKKTSKQLLVGVVSVAFVLSIAWFAFSYFSNPSSAAPAAETVSRALPWHALLPQNLFKSFISFFDFPPDSAFSNFPLLKQIQWLPAALAFALLALPLAFFALKGAWSALREKSKILLSMLSCFLLLLALAAYNSIDNNGVFYVRYLIPVISLVGFFFAKGIETEKPGRLKTAAFAALLLFAFYSAALSSFSALQYKSIAESEMPLYDAISHLPEDSKIASLNKYRQVSFYSGKESSGLAGIGSNSAGFQVYAALEGQGFSHLAVTCYNDDWNPAVLQELERQGKLASVFSRDCLNLFEIK
ncbi:MAG: glycosyltransferase family 39 protein [Candidatus Diapherotrites archaeon]|uniref:Glycosyltransferase family 39 protein n=1 Tax=Candidatus Iainarchaeum sp. TaxID=3101447 RepID=A0A7J4KS40_9ARCH|nr:glycosyltransferase family 39 protein [Candidatus Diapherotrites archaeon]HIH21121.1 glycosyltransferase family 39 protein [Candidatus Diapherotrites archaeon]HIH32813.1 glycosyltransferase family 39 protein [Candidatus Diapherotrites archaeon]